VEEGGGPSDLHNDKATEIEELVLANAVVAVAAVAGDVNKGRRSRAGLAEAQVRFVESRFRLSIQVFSASTEIQTHHWNGSPLIKGTQAET
jgi:hypothetical protein